MGYPPVSHLLAVLMTCEDEKYLEMAANYLKDFAVRADKKKALQIIGPASPYVGKVNDVYRRIFYIKGDEDKLLIEEKNLLEQYIEMNKGFDKVRVQFDFNPMHTF